MATPKPRTNKPARPEAQRRTTVGFYAHEDMKKIDAVRKHLLKKGDVEAGNSRRSTIMAVLDKYHDRYVKPAKPAR